MPTQREFKFTFLIIAVIVVVFVISLWEIVQYLTEHASIKMDWK